MSDTSGSPSLLVVDDTVENLRLLADMLGAHGYEVRPVTSGRQALLAAVSDPPELVLLDINMPEMNGFEVCERLKADERLHDIPVIFLTASSAAADKVEAFAAGGADYITKPFRLEEVLARVHVHVSLRRARVELLASYERLRALERLRDDLVHMVVHDMRSPLGVVMGHLQLLKHELGPLGGNAAADLDAAVQASGALDRMANDLLDVSRLETGMMPLDRRRQDAAEIARRVRSALQGLDRTRQIDVESSGPVDVDCDEAIVYRVLENLVGNAIKHTPAGGRIRVVLSTQERGVRVEVRDEGPGVPVEAREKIFEKFETVKARAERAYHSAGLGLAFCKLAVRAHGGGIGVEDGESGGSVFWFELPR